MKRSCKGEFKIKTEKIKEETTDCCRSPEPIIKKKRSWEGELKIKTEEIKEETKDSFRCTCPIKKERSWEGELKIKTEEIKDETQDCFRCTCPLKKERSCEEVLKIKTEEIKEETKDCCRFKMNTNRARDSGDYGPTLRAYQYDIINKAQSENTIVFLPPGTGKTFVAVMLIKLMSGDTQAKYSDGGKRTLFLLDSPALAEQRKEYIKKFTSLTVGPRPEDEGCLRKLKESSWKKAFDKYQVLVIKAKRFTEILKNNIIGMKNINLLILDECHNAARKVSILKIMRAYQTAQFDERPRLLGLTATLLDKEMPIIRIPRAVSKLEKKLQCTVATVGCVSEIESFVNSPIEKHIPYEDPIEFKYLEVIKSRIKYISEFVIGFGCDESVNNPPFFEETVLYQDIELSRKMVRHLVDVWYNIEKLGVYGGCISALKLMMYMQRLGAKAPTRESAMVYLAFIKILVMIRETLEKKMEGACEIAKIYEYSTCQVTTLLDVLKEFKLGINRCIIFVERRSTAEILFNILKAASNNIENMSYIRADFIIAVGSEPVTSDQRQYLNEGNMEVFERFKTGEINILVTTDITNDGYDMPECKLIIRFDVPKTFRSYLLSKGWSSVKNSYYVILTPKKDKRQVWKTMIEYRSKEEFLYQVLAGQVQYVAQYPDQYIQRNITSMWPDRSNM